MMSLRASLGAAAIVASMVACRANMQSGEFSVYADSYENAQRSIVSQVSFATGCPAAQIKVVVLAVDASDKNFPMSVGADACGKKLVYQYVDGSWVLNAHSGNAGEKQEK